MSTFSDTQLTEASGFIPAASFPSTAGIRANGLCTGYGNLAGALYNFVGSYTIPLRQNGVNGAGGLSAAENVILVNTLQPAGAEVNINWSGQTALTVSSNLSGGLIDSDFHFSIVRVRRAA